METDDLELNSVEHDDIYEQFVQEEAERELSKEPSPKLQAYLDKYEDIDLDTAKRNGVHGVKMMLNDYKSGALKQRYPYLPDDKIVSSIEQLEGKSQEPEDKFIAKVIDIPVQAVGSFRDAVQANMDLGAYVGSLGARKYLGAIGTDSATIDEASKDVKAPQLPQVRQPKSAVGRIVRGVSQFLIPFMAFNKVGKAVGVVGKATSTVGKAAEAALVGSVADFTSFSGYEDRLSNLVEECPELSNPVTRYLKSDPEDGFATSRFKNSVEGIVLGTMTEGMSKGVKRIGNTKMLKDVLGGMTEGMFQAVKWIRDTKISKNIIGVMRKESESRTLLTGKSYDDLLNDLKTIPVRNKKTVSLKDMEKGTEKIKWTKEDLLNGKAIKDIEASKLKPFGIKATMLQEQAVGRVREAIPDYRARIDAGDMSVLDDYWNEMVELHKLDFVAKDINAKASGNMGGANSMVYRRHSSAVEQSNAMYKLFEVADKLDKRKMVEAHMDILESRGDLDGFINGLTMSKGKKIKDVIRNVYMAYRLSSPATHWKNIVSTSLNGLIMSPLEHAVAAGVGSTRRGVASVLDMAGYKISNGFFSNLNDTHRYKQSQILFHSMISSHVDAIKYIGNALRGQTEAAISAKKSGSKLSFLRDISKAAAKNRFDKGLTRDDTAEKTFNALSLGIKKEGKFGTATYHTANMAGDIMQKPGKFIGTYDDAFNGMYFKAYTESETYRMAVNSGISGEKVAEKWSELYNTAIFKPDIDVDALKNAPIKIKSDVLYSEDEVIRNLQENAVKYAEEMTFTGKVDKMTKSMIDFRNAIDDMMPIIPGGTIIMPFIKTSANLVKYFAFDRGPLMLAQKSFYSDLRAGGRRGEMAMTRLGVGTALMGFGAFLKINGYLFGDGPKNMGEKNSYRNLGIPERSIRVGKKFYDIGWMDPLSSFLTYPANIIELADAMDGNMDDGLVKSCTTYFAAGALGLANNFLSKSYMKGLSDFIAIVSEQDEKAMDRFIKEQIAATTVPNAVTFVANQLNPKMQAPDTLWETIKDKAGFNINRPRLDAYGREVMRNPLVHSLLIPITYQNYKDEETTQELINAGVRIDMPKRVIEGVSLTPDFYNDMLMYMGEQDVYGQIERLVKSSIFKNASDSRKAIDEDGDIIHTKKSMVELVYRENLKMAKERLLLKNPELSNKVLDFKLKAYTKPARSAGSTRLLNNLSVDINK